MLQAASTRARATRAHRGLAVRRGPHAARGLVFRIARTPASVRAICCGVSHDSFSVGAGSLMRGGCLERAGRTHACGATLQSSLRPSLHGPVRPTSCDHANYSEERAQCAAARLSNCQDNYAPACELRASNSDHLQATYAKRNRLIRDGQVLSECLRYTLRCALGQSDQMSSNPSAAVHRGSRNARLPRVSRRTARKQPAAACQRGSARGRRVRGM